MATEYLYMPICGTTLVRVLQPSGEIFSQLSTDELIGLYVLSFLPKLPSDTINAEIERILNDLFINIEHNSDESRAAILARLSLEDVRAGAKLMGQFKLRLINAESVSKRSYLLAGRWNFNFRATYSGEFYPARHYGIDNLVTRDQLRALSFVRSGLEEPIHFEAYAGSGKSFLHERIPEVVQSMGIQSREILFLTQSQKQSENMPQRLLKNYTCRTYAQLAFSMMPKHLEGLRRRSAANSPYPYQQIVDYLSIKPIDQYNVQTLLRAAFSTITKYCYSSDNCITSEHLPSWVIDNRITDDAQRDFFLRYLIDIAENIWSLIIHPVPGLEIPVRVYHQIKLIALSGAVIKSNFRLILMDETHDLDPVMAQILDRSPQFVITFGDRFQGVRKPVVTSNARQMQITNSFRSPALFDSAINSVLNKHRYQKTGEFSGNHQLPADIIYYDQEVIPDKPCTIYVSDFWSLWAWMHRLAEARISFRTITPEYDIRQFVLDVFALRNFKTKPTHRQLLKYWSYDRLMQDFTKNASFIFVQDLMDHGYGVNNWLADCKSYISDAGAYAVGLTADGRNTEHDRIMLTSDAVELLWNQRKDIDYDRYSALYVALTRAKYQLIIPTSMYDFVSSSTTGP